MILREVTGISGRGLKVGNVFYFEEYIAGKLLKKEVVFTRIEPGSLIEFKPTWTLNQLAATGFLF